MKRAMSHGMGVQTTTISLMAIAGDIEPYDVAVFADTQAEPQEVYDHLDKLGPVMEAHGTPLVRVTAGSLTNRMLDVNRRDGIQIPVYMKGTDRNDGMLRRQCTEKFKSRPVYKWLNQWREGEHVALTLGISWDEIQRMKPAKRKWITNEYPLVDLRMTRRDCLAYIAEAGWTAPRSACTYCPFHNDDEWRRLRDEHPDDWAEAVRIEHEMREIHADRIAAGATTLTGTPYVHRSMVPLDEVDLRNRDERDRDNGVLSLWDQECEGFCGL